MSLLDLDVRLKTFPTIYNFRDFGGYATRDGRAVIEATLFRSAHLNNLSDLDQQAISDLQIGTVVDLRHAPERRRQPSKWLPGTDPVRTLTLPEEPETAERTVAPHEAFVETELNTPDDARGYMMNSYRTRPHDPVFKDIFRQTLKALASDRTDPRSGMLIHCAAGKDRTGTLCALIQGLLGVSDEDIMADYLLTETAVDIDAILEPAAEMFSQRHGRTISADAIRPMFGVEADYLKASLKAMGDYETYAGETLGIAFSEVEQMRSNYLER